MIYSFPRITGSYLTSSMFTSLGFFTGTATQFQMDIAFAMGEMLLEAEINSFISPITITGSYPFVTNHHVIDLGVGRVTQIKNVTLVEKWDSGDRYISGTYHPIDLLNGYITIDVSPYDNSQCNTCGNYPQGIYRADIAFESGMTTGEFLGNASALVALAMASDMMLKQLYDEGIGYDSQYFEKSTQIGRSIINRVDKFALNGALGASVKANFIRSLIKPIKITKAGKLGR